MIGALALGLVQEGYTPYVAPASDEGQAAIARMKVPEGFEVQLWAAEPRLANPVAMCVSDAGDVYVAETFRLKSGVDDIRDHMDWLDDDVAARTVEDRVAYLQRRLGDKFADYSKDSERVRWIGDTDGDGRADAHVVFADGFDHPSAGIAAGVLAWKDKVFFTCIPDLWELRDTDGDHRADERRALSTGYGVRFALIGHDLHGMAIGPDGRLYFSCGDRGLNVPLPGGGRLLNQFSGAVLRCDLDGSNLEVFATGLRNPQELVFDDYGELFTVDNNSDGGDKARLVHVIEGMDAGWRQSYQWLVEPNLRGPWNDEKLWHPHHEGQAAYIVPPLANICDGPSGLTYNPGTALTPEWSDHFFICDFRGDRASSGIHAFTLKPKGASFELDSFERLIWGTLATDLDFGPDGHLYWSDWVEGWGKTGKGCIYRLVQGAAPNAASSIEVQDLLRSDWSTLNEGAVRSLMGHTDRRVRFAAQLELVRRGKAQLLARLAADPTATVLARLHALWGLGMSASIRRDGPAFETLLRVCADEDPIVRANALRVIPRDDTWKYFDVIAEALDNGDTRVQCAAALAAGRGERSRVTEGGELPLLALVARAGQVDPALRHAATLALANLESEQALAAASQHSSADVRVAATVALRRQHSARVAEFLGDGDERVVIEAARAIYDVPIEAAYPALANLIERKELETTALVRRVLHANFRLGGVARATALARFATREGADELHCWEALDLLSKWAHPPGRDGFTGEWWPLELREADFMPALVCEMRDRGIETAPERVVVAWIALAEQAGAKPLAPDFVRWALDGERDLKVRVAALRAAEKLAPDALEPALAELVLDAEDKIRAAALSAIQALTPDNAYPLLEHAAIGGSREERRVAYAALSKLADPKVDLLLAGELAKLRANLVPAEVALDLVLAAEQRRSMEVVVALKSLYEPRKVDGALAQYVDSLYGGDRERGKKLFREDQETTCLRCHKVEWGEGGQVGPDLNGVGKRLSRVELLESIADPNRRIARGYEGLVLTLDDDSHEAGIMVSETSERIVLRNSQDELIEVETAYVVGRRADLSSMPQDVSKFLSREEMRDLIEFLASL